MLLLWFVAMALNTIGRVGLIQGTVKGEEGAEKLTFGGLFNSGKPFFWRVLGLNFLIGLALFVLFIVLFIPLALGTVATFGIGLICLIPLICLLVPVGWLVKIVVQQANIAVVVEDANILEGIQRGWDVFRANLGNLVLMSLILGIGGAIIGFIIALPILLIIVPAAISATVSGIAESELAFGGSLVVGGLCLLTYIPVLILLGGVLQAYFQSAWTLTYLRLTASSTESETAPLLEESASA